MVKAVCISTVVELKEVPGTWTKEMANLKELGNKVTKGLGKLKKSIITKVKRKQRKQNKQDFKRFKTKKRNIYVV